MTAVHVVLHCELQLSDTDLGILSMNDLHTDSPPKINQWSN